MLESETIAIAIGLLVSVTIGAALIVAALLKAALRPNPHDTIGRDVHPADDVYDFDSWPEFEKWMEDNPQMVERILRDGCKIQSVRKETN